MSKTKQACRGVCIINASLPHEPWQALRTSAFALNGQAKSVHKTWGTWGLQMNQHQCVSVQHVHWDLSALDILSIHHRYIVSWNAHKGRLGVGFRGEGGKNYFPRSEPYGALEARQGSSIFSEWSHHLTVKDRCLLKQKPWHRKQPVQLSCSLQTTLRILYSPCYCQTRALQIHRRLLIKFTWFTGLAEPQSSSSNMWSQDPQTGQLWRLWLQKRLEGPGGFGAGSLHSVIHWNVFQKLKLQGGGGVFVIWGWSKFKT